MDRAERRKFADGRVPATWGRGRAVRIDPPGLYSGDTRVHLTICADVGSPFAAADAATVVCRSIETTATLLGCELLADCLMPNHVHILLVPGRSGRSVAEFLQRMKSFTTTQYRKATGSNLLWQKSARDRVMRPGESVSVLAAYIANNPVRQNLVKSWVDWPYSRVFVDV